MNLHITDFPEYPWKTLDVHKDFSYSFNISPGKKIEEDLFDSSKMKVVSYNENSHVQILAVCDPYGPPFYVRSDIDGLLWSSCCVSQKRHFRLQPEKRIKTAGVPVWYPSPCKL